MKRYQNSALAPRAMGAQSDGGTLTETWKKANDSTYNGQVYFMKGTDTIHTEDRCNKSKTN
jgi:hypothetical protein